MKKKQTNKQTNKQKKKKKKKKKRADFDLTTDTLVEKY